MFNVVSTVCARCLSKDISRARFSSVASLLHCVRNTIPCSQSNTTQSVRPKGLTGIYRALGLKTSLIGYIVRPKGLTLVSLRSIMFKYRSLCYLFVHYVHSYKAHSVRSFTSFSRLFLSKQASLAPIYYCTLLHFVQSLIFSYRSA